MALISHQHQLLVQFVRDEQIYISELVPQLLYVWTSSATCNGAIIHNTYDDVYYRKSCVAVESPQPSRLQSAKRADTNRTAEFRLLRATIEYSTTCSYSAADEDFSLRSVTSSIRHCYDISEQFRRRPQMCRDSITVEPIYRRGKRIILEVLLFLELKWRPFYSYFITNRHAIKPCFGNLTANRPT